MRGYTGWQAIMKPQPLFPNCKRLEMTPELRRELEEDEAPMYREDAKRELDENPPTTHWRDPQD